MFLKLYFCTRFEKNELFVFFTIGILICFGLKNILILAITRFFHLPPTWSIDVDPPPVMVPVLTSSV